MSELISKPCNGLWDSVEYDDQVAFWDEWIHQSFEERAPKGFTRANFELKE